MLTLSETIDKIEKESYSSSSKELVDATLLYLKSYEKFLKIFPKLIFNLQEINLKNSME